MTRIKHISAREILNAKGNPTVETTVVLEDGSVGTTSVPSGTSVSTYEAVDLKDNDMHHFQGNGVRTAVQNVTNIIAPALVEKDPTSQKDIDAIMRDVDGTPNKSHLGANAILSVSLAVAKAAATSEHRELFDYIGQLSHHTAVHMPTPLFNVINGGKHAIGSFDFQEFIVTPDTKHTYSEALQIGYTIYHTLHQMLLLNNLSTLVGDEGGFSPHLQDNTHALEFLQDAIQEAGYSVGHDVFLGFDAAASSFYQHNRYQLQEKKHPLSAHDMVMHYEQLAQKYNLLYMEDILAEDDWAGWEEAVPVLSPHVFVVGDDLISTNPARLQMAIDQKAITGVIIKPNQIGTLTETLQVVEKAQQAGITIVVSHRSGETNDDCITDIAVGVGADYCKFGAPARGERIAKYNRLLAIEHELEHI